MTKKDELMNAFSDMSAGQMRPLQLDIKDNLIKMLTEAKRVLIIISRDEGGVITDHVISKANFEFNENFLIVNEQIQIPIHDDSIEFVYQDNAEINYIDADGFMNNVKIQTK